MRRPMLMWLELAGWFGLALVYLAVLGKEIALWWQLFIIWTGFMVLYLILRRLGHRAECLLPTAFLVGLGWLFMLRIQPAYASQQFRGFLVGSAAFCVGIWGGWTRTRVKYIFGLSALLMLAATLTFGTRVGGAKAWLDLGIIRFQPVEFARVLLVMFIVRYLVENRTLLNAKHGWAAVKYWGPLMVFVSGVFLLLAVQRDLGPALLLYAVFCLLAAAVVFSWRLIAASLVIAAAAFGAAFYIFPHLRTRLTAWLSPWDYAEGAGYQVLQGLFALNRGKVLGKGIGLGLGEVIPEVHTDFIFALIGEELGFFGAAAVLSAYLLLAYSGIKLARDAAEPLEYYTALGIVLLWSVQVFMVVGGILRVLPVTGMTLPFLSYGSSSLAAQMWMLGILVSIGQVRPE